MALWRRQLEGHVKEILGFADDPGVDVKSVIRKFRWPELFSLELERLARNMPENPTERDWEGRLDLRDRMIFTIDGPEAKDFDDAISLEKDSQDHYKLGVHIADVSHYVQEGSQLDQEALERGTSLYLADRVLPMLPHYLSDGLCSLREGVPRLTLSAFIDFAPDGKPKSTTFFKSVIQSRRRGVYEDVQQVMDGRATVEIRAKYAPLEKTLRVMMELSRLLRKRREDLGALDFDFPEIRSLLGETGQVIDIQKKERLESHRLIEDFMIAANEAVATYLNQKEIPAIYRIHEPPNPVDLEELLNFLRAYHVPTKQLKLETQHGLHTLLKTVKGTSLEGPVSNLTLRSLKLAVYSPRNAGHFALALKSYCHFTSPIRRYPDLVVHRSLKTALQGRPNPHRKSFDKISLHCSDRERLAEKAERETQKLLQLRFMLDKVNRQFEGVVRHVTAHGAYVELQPYGMEGFLPLENMVGDEYRVRLRRAVAARETRLQNSAGRSNQSKRGFRGHVLPTHDSSGTTWLTGHRLCTIEKLTSITSSWKSLRPGLPWPVAEVKSIRNGKANLQDSFGRVEKGEIFLYGMHISPYEQGNRYNPDPTRVRKLLLKKPEIAKLTSRVQEKGLTLVPTKLYFKSGKVKIPAGRRQGQIPGGQAGKAEGKGSQPGYREGRAGDRGSEG